MSLNVVTIKPPYLASSDVPALQAFLRKWKTYVRNVESYNEQSGRNANIPVARLRTCLNSNVLDYICNFELQDADPYDISNEHLLEYFNGVVSAADDDLDLLRLEALLTSEFDRKFHESRDRLSLIDQFRVAWEALYGMIVQKGVLHLFGTERGVAVVRKIVFKTFKPYHSLHHRAKRHFESLSPEASLAQKNMLGLHKLLMKCCKEQEREVALFRGQKYGTPKQSKRKGNIGNEKSVKEKKNKRTRQVEKRSQDQNQVYGRTGSKKPKYSGVVCWNCNQKGHYSSSCPQPINTERRRAWGKSQEEQTPSRPALSAISSPDTLVDCWLGRQRIQLKALLDSGAFTSFVDEEVARKANLVRIDAEVPSRLPLAVKNSEAQILGAVQGEVTLFRSGEDAHVFLRSVNFMVLKGGHDFVIIGNDILKRLGISPQDQLNKLSVRLEYNVPICSAARKKEESKALREEVPGSVSEHRYQRGCRSTWSLGEVQSLNGPEATDSAVLYQREGRSTWSLGEVQSLKRPEATDIVHCYEARHGDARNVRSRLRLTLDSMIERSRPVFNTDELISDLRRLVYEYEDIWREDLMDDLVLGNIEPIKVEPFQIRLKQGAIPRRATMRAYNRIERDFLKKMTEDLTAINCLYRNLNSRWSSPSYVVKKPGKKGDKLEDFRWTGDIRYVNSVTERLAGSMPLMSTLLEHLSDAKVFASLDCHKGYWQIPICKKSQEICSFLTPQGIFSPTRLMQGHTDSVAVFQQTMEQVFEGLIPNQLLIWIDDLLSHASTAEELLSSLREIFQRCRDFNLRISPAKSNLGLTSIKWCGRIISGNGIKFDPEMIRGLINLKRPRTAGELQHLLAASNWIRTSLPQYAKTVGHLTELLNNHQKAAGSSRKRKLSKRSLKWDANALRSYENLKSLLANNVELSHFKYSADYVLCLFTDASESYWGIILTQVERSEWDRKPVRAQKHHPIAFLSGRFCGSHFHWPMIIKEAYPIIIALEKLRQYLSLKEFVLYTDHRNLVYVFNHLPKTCDVKKNVSHMLQRWHIKLMGFNYAVKHIAGADNLWADLLSRFQSPDSPLGAILSYPSDSMLDFECDRSFSPSPMSKNRPSMGKYGFVADEQSFVVCAFDGRTEEEEIDIINASLRGSVNLEYSDVIDEVKELKKNGAGLLVVESKSLRLSLMILSHCGLSGHRGFSASLGNLKAFTWPGMKEDLKLFCDKCVHCLVARSYGLKTLIGSQIHASKPNEVLHFDFLYIKDKKYILVIKDDLSSFVELFICEKADHFHVVDSLLWWKARHGLKQGTVFISDQGSHFKNLILKELARTLGVTHRFTPSHTPRANGTVEVVNRIFLKLLRALKSEFHIKIWENLVSFIQCSLNSTPAGNLNGFTPIEVFSGRQVDSPINLLFDKRKDVLYDKQPAAVTLKLLEELRESMNTIHREVFHHKEHRRKISRKSRNKNREDHEYYKGDFVFLRYVSPKEKTQARSLIYVVEDVVSKHIVLVKHMLTGVTKEVHTERLMPFTAKKLNLKLLKEHVQFHTEYEVEDLLEIKIDDKTGEELVLVKWRGFEDSESSWEPLDMIEQDQPKLVERLRRKLS